MNARVANLASELVPVAGAAMLAGRTFAAAQMHPHCTHVEGTVKDADVTMTTDGIDPAAEGAIFHTIPNGSNFTWKREKFLASRFGGAGNVVVSQMCLG
jgi:hypothetical protein